LADKIVEDKTHTTLHDKSSQCYQMTKMSDYRMTHYRFFSMDFVGR